MGREDADGAPEAAATTATELRRGWLLLAASFLGIMMGAWSLPFYTLGPMAGAISGNFGWPLSAILATVPFLAAGMTLGTPLIGWLADRYSARLVAGGSAVALGFCFAILALSNGNLWLFRAVYFTMGFLGAGSGGIVYTRVIGARFDRARGIALGLALCGTGFGSFLSPLLSHALTEAWGWRSVYWTLAAIILIIELPIIYLGLPGKEPPRLSGGATAAPTTGLSRSEAMRDPRFYAMLLCICIFGTFITSMVFNIIPVLSQQGFDPGQAARIASLAGISTIAGRLLIGWLLDHAPAHHVGTGCFLFGALAVGLFAWHGGLTIVLAVIAIGFLTGAEFDLVSFMIARYFGLRHYGAIFGLLYSTYTAFGIGGPIFCAWLIATHGTISIFAAASFGFAIATIAMAAIPMAGRR